MILKDCGYLKIEINNLNALSNLLIIKTININPSKWSLLTKKEQFLFSEFSVHIVRNLCKRFIYILNSIIPRSSKNHFDTLCYIYGSFTISSQLKYVTSDLCILNVDMAIRIRLWDFMVILLLMF